MRFELEPNSRDITKEQVLSDIAAVAEKLGLISLTIDQYNKDGRYASSLARQRCGSWLQAIAGAGLSAKRKNSKASPDEFIPDLKRVAEVLGKSSVTQTEYQEHGRFGPGVVSRHFGGWLEALRAAGLEKTREYGVSDEEYFLNLETMWVHLGRQPRYGEIRRPLSRYSAGAYERRFGSWREALESLVASVNQEPDERSAHEEPGPEEKIESIAPVVEPGRSRSISWRHRFLVMRRDDFKCRCCGNSPALSPGLVLHVDHIHPWCKGGHTTQDNLQTLCEQCNIGKSDLPMTEDKKG
jgi:hypothetical protein